jgi:hypothetical protein
MVAQPDWDHVHDKFDPVTTGTSHLERFAYFGRVFLPVYGREAKQQE